MEWLANNWYLIVATIAVTSLLVYVVGRFIQEPSETKIKNLKEWLKWAVVQAEIALGSGTGQLKLRMVYNMAVDKFPFIAKFVTFEEFSAWVDEALEWMNKQLETNNSIKRLVNGGEKDESADNIQ